jgi:hypothetical protein
MRVARRQKLTPLLKMTMRFCRRAGVAITTYRALSLILTIGDFNLMVDTNTSELEEHTSTVVTTTFNPNKLS